MTIFVTGGAGFIGSNFVLQWIQEKSETVVNLDKLTYAGNKDNLASVINDKQHVFVEGDIGDGELVNKLLKKYKPRAIVNFAAESHVDRSINSPENFIQTNILGTFKLLDCTKNYWSELSDEKKTFRFLHISTDEVYGTLEANDPAFTEGNQYKPNSPYSASKASSDHLVRAYHHTYELPTLVTNCSNNYGPFQFPEKLIPLVINNALNDKELPVYGDGQQTRDWLFVEDHCNAIMTVLSRGKVGEVYNIGGLNEVANIKTVKTICALLDEMRPRQDGRSYSEQIAFIPDRPGHDRRYAIDATKIKTELGWEPKTKFATGIRKTVRWYLDNPEWMTRLWPHKQ